MNFQPIHPDIVTGQSRSCNGTSMPDCFIYTLPTVNVIVDTQKTAENRATFDSAPIAEFTAGLPHVVTIAESAAETASVDSCAAPGRGAVALGQRADGHAGSVSGSVLGVGERNCGTAQPHVANLDAIIAATRSDPLYANMRAAAAWARVTPGHYFAQNPVPLALMADAAKHIAAAIVSIKAAVKYTSDDVAVEQLEGFLLDAPWLVTAYLDTAVAALGDGE